MPANAISAPGDAPCCFIRFRRKTSTSQAMPAPITASGGQNHFGHSGLPSIVGLRPQVFEFLRRHAELVSGDEAKQ